MVLYMGALLNHFYALPCYLLLIEEAPANVLSNAKFGSILYLAFELLGH